MAKLTAKQAAFVNEYLIDLNATQAAIRAGYSTKTAGKIGFENLQKPEIAAAVAEAQAERADTTHLSAEWVLERLKREAEGEGPDTNSAARTKALDLLGRHLALFIDRVEQSGEMTVRVIRE